MGRWTTCRSPSPGPDRPEAVRPGPPAAELLVIALAVEPTFSLFEIGWWTADSPTFPGTQSVVSGPLTCRAEAPDGFVPDLVRRATRVITAHQEQPVVSPQPRNTLNLPVATTA